MTSNRRSFASPPALVVLAFAALVGSFVACQGTQDPRPGSGEYGSGSGGRSGTGGPSGTGGRVQFGGAGGELVQGVECGEPPVSTEPFTKARLLASAGACVAHQTCGLLSAVTDLGRAVTAYAEEPNEDTLGRARNAWFGAMDAWSLVGPSAYGPMASVGADKYHGRGIGAFVHAWPALNRCEIEKQIVLRDYEEQGFARILPAARGLPALEYLLFYEGTDTICAANATATKTWATLGDAELATAKTDYAKAVVEDLYRKVEELTNVWATGGEDFGATLQSAEGYGSEQEALNVVATSLLYLYEAVRDRKVEPWTTGSTVPPNVESAYAFAERESVLANIRAFRSLYQGCGVEGEGLGFDDWLVEAGAETLNAELLAALERIEDTAQTLPPFHEASSGEMDQFFDDLKVLSDLMKEQLFGSGSVLNLKLPASAASDTD